MAWTSFEQENAVPRVLHDARCDHASSGAGTDDNMREGKWLQFGLRRASSFEP